MKIYQLSGRGLEGCGVTRHIIEMNKGLKALGHDVTIFEVKDKSWPRGKYQPIDNLIEIPAEDLLNHLEDFNTADIVMLHGVPSIKHSEIAKSNFLEFVQKLTTVSILFQNDHKIQSIRRNANLIETAQAVTKISTFTANTPFYQFLVKNLGESIKDKCIYMGHPYEFDLKKTNWQDTHYRRITYLGRFATFKDPGRLIRMREKAFENNYQLEMRGIERSIGAICNPDLFFHYNEKGEKLGVSQYTLEISKKYLKEHGLKPDTNFIHDQNREKKVYIFGPYIRTEGIEALCHSAFGCDFYQLSKPEYYGDLFEYAMAEVVDAGVIGIFDYDAGDSCYVHENGKRTGKKFREVNSGLYLKKDLSNLDEIITKCNELMDNPELYNKFREEAFEIFQKHFDNKVVVNKILFEALNENNT